MINKTPTQCQCKDGYIIAPDGNTCIEKSMCNGSGYKYNEATHHCICDSANNYIISLNGQRCI